MYSFFHTFDVGLKYGLAIILLFYAGYMAASLFSFAYNKLSTLAMKEKMRYYDMRISIMEEISRVDKLYNQALADNRNPALIAEYQQVSIELWAICNMMKTGPMTKLEATQRVNKIRARGLSFLRLAPKKSAS